MRRLASRPFRKRYGQFSKFHVCFCGLDPGNLKFETVRRNKRTYLLLGLETLNLKFCDLKLWKLTVLSTWTARHRTLQLQSVFIISNRKISDWASQVLKANMFACLSVLSQISNCQGPGRKNKHEISKTDRTVMTSALRRSVRTLQRRHQHKRAPLLWGELRGSQGRGFEHRSTWGFEHVESREVNTIKPVVTYDPHSLGPP